MGYLKRCARGGDGGVMDDDVAMSAREFLREGAAQDGMQCTISPPPRYWMRSLLINSINLL